MAVLKFDGKPYTVDHAVKGSDFVHGYAADGSILISIEGVRDFSLISYDGTYLNPEECFAEGCNDTKYCNNELKTADGRIVPVSVAAMSAGTAKTQHINATLLATSWVADDSVGFKQSITVPALSDLQKAKVYPAWPTTLAEKLAISEETPKVRACTRTGNVLTFECWEEVPALDIPVVVEVYV